MAYRHDVDAVYFGTAIAGVLFFLIRAGFGGFIPHSADAGFSYPIGVLLSPGAGVCACPI